MVPPNCSFHVWTEYTMCVRNTGTPEMFILPWCTRMYWFSEDQGQVRKNYGRGKLHEKWHKNSLRYDPLISFSGVNVCIVRMQFRHSASAMLALPFDCISIVTLLPFITPLPWLHAVKCPSNVHSKILVEVVGHPGAFHLLMFKYMNVDMLLFYQTVFHILSTCILCNRWTPPWWTLTSVWKKIPIVPDFNLSFWVSLVQFCFANASIPSLSII